ncbi:transcription factor PIF3 [Oxalobacter formigenes HOxBLS]|uniref:Transcription factor PIF3 n=1 Tax=Oxalobacter paraformigenes TaxID=556268 RepID=T5LV44_9BURK|nr:transcription factor PIF3 [Oxalobacter paraformigenes]
MIDRFFYLSSRFIEVPLVEKVLPGNPCRFILKAAVLLPSVLLRRYSVVCVRAGYSLPCQGLACGIDQSGSLSFLSAGPIRMAKSVMKAACPLFSFVRPPKGL